MRTYELVLIFHPELDENALNEALDKVKGWITAGGGSISKVDNWGQKRLAYLIRKQREGQYFLLTAEMDPALTSELDRNLRFHEPVIRYMITVVA